MKKVFKFLFVFLGIFLFLGVIGFSYIYFRDIPSYEITSINYHATNSPEAVKRGEKLASMLCAGCHINHETGKLTGVKMIDAPAEFGEIYSQNITQDKNYGIGNWTDADLLRLFRTGIKKNGQYAPPYMAKLNHMGDEDINAIISFLKSNHPMVVPDATPDTPCKPSFLTKLLSTIEWKPFPMPENKIEVPDTTDTVKLGKYLAYNLECYSCHSADFKTNNFMQPDLSKGYFGGGNKPLDMQARIMLTPNLTPDKETGIGNWSKEKFIKAVKYGIVEKSPALHYPMMPYVQLTDTEAGAIYDYLQTLKPIKNKVIRSVYQE